jgi:hypothetical protein
VKKILPLILAMILIMVLAAPLMAAAEVAAAPPDTPETVDAAPAEAVTQPVLVYTTGADPPAAAIDLTPLLQAVASLAVSLITAFLIPWIRAKYSAEQRKKIAAVYSTMVYAAEQMFGAGAGDQKLEWVTNQLASKGFTVDRATIEAEVKRMQDFAQLIVESPTTDT